MGCQYDATQRGKPTYGLETMQEQIAVFNGMSLETRSYCCATRCRMFSSLKMPWKNSPAPTSGAT